RPALRERRRISQRAKGQFYRTARGRGAGTWGGGADQGRPLRPRLASQNSNCAPNFTYRACRIFNGLSQADPNVVLMAAGGSPALEVAPTAAFEFSALKMSAMICSRCDPRRLMFFDTRRSSCVRRGVYMVPGLTSGTVRDVLAPPDSARPSVPVWAMSAWVMFQLARICWPGRFCSTAPIWIACHGSVYEPVAFSWLSQLVSKSQ